MRAMDEMEAMEQVFCPRWQSYSSNVSNVYKKRQGQALRIKGATLLAICSRRAFHYCGTREAFHVSLTFTNNVWALHVEHGATPR